MLIDYVTELLKDGKWHYVRTLARKLDQPEGRIKEVLNFCAEFDLVKLDQTGNRAKIDETLRKLLA